MNKKGKQHIENVESSRRVGKPCLTPRLREHSNIGELERVVHFTLGVFMISSKDDP